MDPLTEGELKEQKIEAAFLESTALPRTPVNVCKSMYLSWKTPKPHPVTGDLLQGGERVTWKVMSVYRRWSVFFLLQVLTIVWWTHPFLFPGGLVGWNLLWSDLAVIVEMMVGIAFMNQSMRDAKIIRNSLADLQEIAIGQKKITEDHDADMLMLRALYHAVHPDGEGNLIVSIDGEKHTLELSGPTLPDPVTQEDFDG
jgi:hypothetical protein